MFIKILLFLAGAWVGVLTTVLVLGLCKCASDPKKEDKNCS